MRLQQFPKNTNIRFSSARMCSGIEFPLKILKEQPYTVRKKQPVRNTQKSQNMNRVATTEMADSLKH